ncbi:MAG: hypothetical protein QM770_03775 [Tepidisphaeraceae bacterium]
MIYCNDSDLLAWEPNLAAEASFAAQTLLQQDVTLDGSTLILSGDGPSFDDSRVRAGHIAVLGGSMPGCFPIIALTTASRAVISRSHELLPAAGAATPENAASFAVAVGTGTGIPLAVRTFAPQRMVVSEVLRRLAGVDETRGETLLNTASLKRPAVLGTLQMIYNALAAAGGDGAAELIVRAELYERLYRRSLRNVVVEIDTDGDGRANVQRLLRTARLVRA